MTKIALVLSGCGVQDGSEIHESVLALLALDRLNVEILCTAPNIPLQVVDHLTNAPTTDSRNVLAESARIARGAIRDVATLTPDEVDGAILPGGYGAAKNLCDFAAGAADYAVEPNTARFLRGLHAAHKPIGAICIAPAIVARLFGAEGVTLTIGTDRATAERLARTGAKHRDCAVGDVVVDEERRIVTTPAYMLAGRISEAAEGIEKLCREVVRMAR